VCVCIAPGDEPFPAISSLNQIIVCGGDGGATRNHAFSAAQFGHGGLSFFGFTHYDF